jgi:branched-chain amino acid transport system permease protein
MLSVISLGVWLTFAIGRINIGQGAFALVGGYVTAILTTRFGVSFWLALPASGLAGALLAAVIGWPILRLRGIYFAMLTLTLTEAVRLLALNAEGITQGPTGILNIPTPGSIALAGIVLVPAFSAVSTHLAFYYLAAVILTAGLLVIYRINTCRLGWTFRSLQQDEALAASVGVDVAKYRVMAFTICSAFAGIGGAFFAASVQSVYPSSFQVPDSIFFMLYCFFGGLSYVFGPVVGAFVLFIAFELLAGLREYQTVIYALIMIFTMLLLPNGVLSLRLPTAGAVGRWIPSTSAFFRRMAVRVANRGRGVAYRR